MPGLQQLLTHTLILAMTVGGIACLCPADAAGASPVAAAHANHGHAGGIHGGAGSGGADTAGCGHESCGSDCTRASAVHGKAETTIPGKTTGGLDDLEVPPVIPAMLPSASAPLRQAFPSSRQLLLPQDSPVRRFDRLLD